MEKPNSQCNDIYFINLTKNSIQLSQWLKESKQDFKWIYISDNYTSLLECRRLLDGFATEIQTSKKLHEVALATKKSFLSWMGAASSQASQGYWWASRVTEKNTIVSDVFIDICKLKVLSQVLSSEHKPVLLIDTPPTLIKAIKSDWRFRQRIKMLPLLSRIKTEKPFQIKLARMKFPRLYSYIKLLKEISKYFKVYFAYKIWPAFKQNSISGPLILRHTFLSEQQFNEVGDFEDIYYPGLDEYLSEKGYLPIILAVTTGTKKSRKSAERKMKQSNSYFILPHAHYHFSDYLHAFWVAHSTKKICKDLSDFDGFDVTEIIRTEAITKAYDTIDNILYTRLPLRLSQQGYDVRALIAEFENMIPEKMLIEGFRKTLPKTELIGVQHSALFPLLLCLFTPIEERCYAPMYDKIICNGDLFKQILIEEGFPSERATIGASLRYSHLWQLKQSSFQAYTSREYDIAIPLSLSYPHSVELLHKAIKAFADKDFVVVIKSHPMCSIDQILKIANLRKLPKNFYIHEGNLGSMLSSSKAMINFGTTSAFEAIALGVPVIRLRSEVLINLDPLEYFGAMFSQATNPVELLQVTNKVLSWNQGYWRKYQNQCVEVINSAFTKKNDETLMHFLPGRCYD